MFNWLRQFFRLRKDEIDMIQAIDEFFKEYDVYVLPKGQYRKISKLEVLFKYRKKYENNR